MATQLKTPGVYITDPNPFPNTMQQAPTAIPVFIGYTEKASANGKSLLKVPTAVTSLAEYEAYFGGAFPAKFSLVPTTAKNFDIYLNGLTYFVRATNNNTAYFYNSIRLFYANGGGVCYILSVGTYGDKPGGFAIDPADFVGTTPQSNVFNILTNQQDVTLVVMPDAIALGQDCYTSLYIPALQHCATSQSRMALLDVELVRSPELLTNAVNAFRQQVYADISTLSFGAAYCPWLNTTLVQFSEITMDNLDAGVDLSTLLPDENAQKVLAQYNNGKPVSDKDKQAMQAALLAVSQPYRDLMNAILTEVNILPPTAAIAGIYTTIDSDQGVWVAPANVSITAATKAVITLSDTDQSFLNIDPLTGKSINAIRVFSKLGMLVWGARTLDGNSYDLRYINARRTLIMIEQSIKLAIRAYAFEPNTSITWVTVQSMISNFLTGLWKQGALVGATPSDAYSVSVGLGSTMTADDILNGYMNVTVKVAITHPAEFIVITIQQQMQAT